MLLEGLFWVVVAFAAVFGLCYINGATNIGRDDRGKDAGA